MNEEVILVFEKFETIALRLTVRSDGNFKLFFFRRGVSLIRFQASASGNLAYKINDLLLLCRRHDYCFPC